RWRRAAAGPGTSRGRRRPAAPLLLGGGTLALVALHELAPHVAQVFDALPRWSVPALAGLLLLALGATYELTATYPPGRARWVRLSPPAGRRCAAPGHRRPAA
ncbi:SCO7613 C-terminal domain-containing membrane protein, partial [Streptomyces roseolus]|uniref:SCO7613 C-terminal domain-containing membrane protein n=1 Tax=Streptomyces roseolus TaxID=67358 RepID=UPI00364672B8